MQELHSNFTFLPPAVDITEQRSAEEASWTLYGKALFTKQFSDQKSSPNNMLTKYPPSLSARQWT